MYYLLENLIKACRDNVFYFIDIRLIQAKLFFGNHRAWT
jgi:hypothetical protein